MGTISPRSVTLPLRVDELNVWKVWAGCVYSAGNCLWTNAYGATWA